MFFFGKTRKRVNVSIEKKRRFWRFNAGYANSEDLYEFPNPKFFPLASLIYFTFYLSLIFCTVYFLFACNKGCNLTGSLLPAYRLGVIFLLLRIITVENRRALYRTSQSTVN